MDIASCSHSISPAKVIRGENAWGIGKKIIPSICNAPILIGRSKATLNIRNILLFDLRELGLEVLSVELNFDCCELDLSRLKELATSNSCDAVITAGGGKVLDAGKLLANRLSLPCITIPTSAATCAGWTALSNIYSKEGAFIKDESLRSCPELLIFDHSFVRQAPPRTLASGIADGLAKWYEASTTSVSSNDGLVQQAVQMARVLRDQLFIDGYEAFQNPNSDAWVRVAEGCALTAGLIGGIGGSKCRTAAAHALHNGLTQLKSTDKFLHGEVVCFGIIVQLHLEERHKENQLAKQARKQLIQFLEKLNLPTSLDELRLSNVCFKQIEEACIFACKDGSDIHKLPFKVNKEMLLEALNATNGQRIIPKRQKSHKNKAN
ncbi:iron-containing alcohol dehydrogenase family protein [Prochlorococcus sp. MIT 1307]|uniref:iron-containing alcohol dehydrogenase family protein n=1 Tax=Prochlorococcus sp. MIT 1307 TaxID=3096219 RepID=UPI002A7510E1|nr:iron-containing alcohol dehydrogenase family protein [Prochlorococcus sp. MIT 1307]